MRERDRIAHDHGQRVDAGEPLQTAAGTRPRTGEAAPAPPVRELEQCVRNVMIRGEYRPPHAARVSGRQRVAEEMLAGSLNADELLRRYCTLVYAETGSYRETARRLDLDRRTVKDKVDPEPEISLTGGCARCTRGRRMASAAR